MGDHEARTAAGLDDEEGTELRAGRGDGSRATEPSAEIADEPLRGCRDEAEEDDDMTDRQKRAERSEEWEGEKRRD